MIATYGARESAIGQPVEEIDRGRAIVVINQILSRAIFNICETERLFVALGNPGSSRPGRC
jgi:hypothetical protein